MNEPSHPLRPPGDPTFTVEVDEGTFDVFHLPAGYTLAFLAGESVWPIALALPGHPSADELCPG
jgi:hypothetical protein